MMVKNEINKIINVTIFLFLFIVGSQSCTAKKDNTKPKNILFISIDDLRPELGCYGNDFIQSPNIDKLAAQGVQFNNAYCQQALCVPSRSSVLTGKRPTTINCEFFGAHFRTHHPNTVTLPQVFQKLGYKVNAVGKVFHHRDTLSWDERAWVPEPSFYYPMYAQEKSMELQRQTIESGNAFDKDPKFWWAKGDKYVPGPSWESTAVHDTDLFDGKITNKAIKYLQKNSDEPFFLAVGYFRPHIPFVAPQKYFDMYPMEKIELPADTFPPLDAPDIALHNWGETRYYTDIPKNGSITSDKKKELLRGYYACISYVDAQIGRLLNELEELGLDQNTLVVLWGDHGYHLGDLGLWGKYTNFEQATRSPLLFYVPWENSIKNKNDNIVELLDIYPTILDFIDLEIPLDLEGKSLRKYIVEPDLEMDNLAFSEYTKNGYTGFSVRNKDYRYTWWRPRKDNTKKAYHELYKYNSCRVEKQNLADNPEFQEIKNYLHNQIISEYKLSN